jgi:hypothetical protein
MTKRIQKFLIIRVRRGSFYVMNVTKTFTNVTYHDNIVVRIQWRFTSGLSFATDAVMLRHSQCDWPRTFVLYPHLVVDNRSHLTVRQPNRASWTKGYRLWLIFSILRPDTYLQGCRRLPQSLLSNDGTVLLNRAMLFQNVKIYKYWITTQNIIFIGNDTFNPQELTYMEQQATACY